MLRIIAGQRRGHKFEGPDGKGTRPTSDFVREAMFNILGDRVDGRLVVDLCAGTGALGLEALSRGASRTIFVELKREVVALIRRNVAVLRFEDRATVQTADVYRWARGFVAVDDDPVVVFLDPPYKEYANHPQRVAGLLTTLVEKLPTGSILVIEAGPAPREGDEEILPEPEAWDVRKYGRTRVALRTVGEGIMGSGEFGDEVDGEDAEADDDDDDNL